MSPEKPKKETPSSHPSSEGLGNAIRAGVQDELERLGIGGGGGGGGDRLSALEREVAVIKETMVKKEDLQKELGLVRLEVSKISDSVITKLFILITIMGVIVGGVFALIKYLKP